MRIVGLDYGRKKVGVAVTDPLQIIVNGLATVPTTQLTSFLSTYFLNEKVEKIVVGWPTHKDGTPTVLTKDIEYFSNWLQKNYPLIEIVYQDEHLTTQLAEDKLRELGVSRKKKHQNLIDQISAVLILQLYLKHI